MNSMHNATTSTHASVKKFAAVAVCLAAALAAAAADTPPASPPAPPATPASPDVLTLAHKNASDYVIILSAQASESEQFAAAELADWLGRLSGAELPIRAEGGERPERAIYVGDGAAARAAGLDLGSDLNLKQLGNDGLALRCLGEDIFIVGGRRRGTLYGVYELLERLGIRWWTPTETFLPARASTLSISRDKLNTTQVPTLDYRDMMYGEAFSPDGMLWCARNKVNGFAWQDAPAHLGGRYRFVGNLVHSYMGLLAEGVEGEITPDMLALYKGRRQKTQPCLTNPKVLDAIVRAVIEKYRRNPDARFVVVGQNDNHGYCRCEQCQAIMDRYQAPSGVVVWFANCVLAEVRKTLPEAKIATAAYEWSRKAPVGIAPSPGVYITLCSIECDFAHPLATAETEANRAFRQDIIDWGKLAEKIFIWDYTPNFRNFLMPHPNFDVLAPNIRFFAEHAAAGVFEQGSHTTEAAEFSALRMWVLARCLWEPQSDGRTLIDEFVHGYYGPAAGPVADYIRLMHQVVRDRPDFTMRTFMEPGAPYCAPETIAEGNRLLAAAERLVAHQPAYLRRVRQVRLGPWGVMLRAGADSETWAAATAAVDGDLDYAATAALLSDTAGDWSLTRLSEGSSIEPSLNWLADYAAALKDNVPPTPAEAPAGARVIQAGQFDWKMNTLAPAEGASDGWALACDTDAWLYRKYFTTFDDITPGRTTRLFIRVKGVARDAETPAEPAAESPAAEAPANAAPAAETPEGEKTAAVDQRGAFSAGIRSSSGNKSIRLQMDQIQPGAWQAVEVARWQAQPGDYFYFALVRDGGLKEILLDCAWLVQE